MEIETNHYFKNIKCVVVVNFSTTVDYNHKACKNNARRIFRPTTVLQVIKGRYLTTNKLQN